MYQLFNDDCFNIMPQIPDSSIDFILCDPPYGTTPLKWDSVLPFDKMWNEYNRIIKDNGCIAIFGQEPFSSFVRCSNIKYYKYDWYWQKEQPTNVFQVKRRPGKVIENISIFYKNVGTYNPQKTKYEGPLRRNKIGDTPIGQLVGGGTAVEYHDDRTRYPLQVIHFKREIRKKNMIFHPTQKPVALLEYLIKTYTNEGELVLDNCMGSGSTGVACINTNRDFIGIELENKYYEIAEKRIKDVRNI